ncbi:hypothetical protein B0J14DRAFT_595704 [Halenospora varia]|nr:hypothetical protein B0J14DRAFT_595704 [Halenospora varia]
MRSSTFGKMSTYYMSITSMLGYKVNSHPKTHVAIKFLPPFYMPSIAPGLLQFHLSCTSLFLSESPKTTSLYTDSTSILPSDYTNFKMHNQLTPLILALLQPLLTSAQIIPINSIDIIPSSPADTVPIPSLAILPISNGNLDVNGMTSSTSSISYASTTSTATSETYMSTMTSISSESVPPPMSNSTITSETGSMTTMDTLTTMTSEASTSTKSHHNSTITHKTTKTSEPTTQTTGTTVQPTSTAAVQTGAASEGAVEVRKRLSLNDSLFLYFYAALKGGGIIQVLHHQEKACISFSKVLPIITRGYLLNREITSQPTSWPRKRKENVHLTKTRQTSKSDHNNGMPKTNTSLYHPKGIAVVRPRDMKRNTEPKTPRSITPMTSWDNEAIVPSTSRYSN